MSLGVPVMLMAADVKGMLKDAGSKPMSGYLLKNLSNNSIAVTNKRGVFFIKAEKGDTLQVYLNETLLETSVVAGENIIIRLPNNPYKEVIIPVAYGKIDRVRTSAAVDMINFDILEDHSFVNTQHSLIGKLASVTTIQNSGLPGNDNLNFYIRGKSSFNSNSPLILVDGFESSMAHLSNFEIENVSVLKDAVATALYGLRGANGVILVNTKKGVEGKTQFKVGIDFGIAQPVNIPKFVDARSYATMVNEAHANDGLSPRYSDEQLLAQGTNPYLYPNVNWCDEMLKKSSFITNASVQVMGGSNRIRYYTLLNHTFYEGAFLHTNENPKYNTQNKFNRLNFRTNLSMDIFSNTELGIRIGGRIQNGVNPEAGSSAFYNNLLSTPSNRYAIYNPDGSYGGNNKYQTNPMGQMVGKGYTDNHSRFINMNVDLRHKMDYLLKGLFVDMAVSFMNTVNVNEKYTASYAVYEPALIEGIDEEGDPYTRPGYIEYGKNKLLVYNGRDVSQNRTQNFRGAVNYDAVFGVHSINSSIIFDASEQIIKDEAEPYRYLNLAFSANYGFKDKYFVDITASYNGTNTYASKKRFGFFPAIGASWILSKESFMEELSAINFMKFRMSYGLTGSDAIGDYRRFMYLNNFAGNGNYRFGETANQSFSGLSEAALSNPDAKWENGYKLNLGFDTRLFRNLSFTFDYFYEKRTDILQSIHPIVTDMVGIGLPRINYGQVKKSGFDMTFGYENTYKNGISWRGEFNAGFVKDKIIKKYQLPKAVYSEIGNSLSGIYGYVASGFYKDAADIASNPRNTLYAVQPGDIKYVNQNSDEVISAYDKVLLGNNFPKFHFGINLSVGYKGFYLSAQLDGQTNYQLNLGGNIVYKPLQNGYNNISEYAATNYWTPERAETATLPRLTTFDNFNNNANNSLYMKNGSFLRVRTAELGYNLPDKVLKVLRMSACKIYGRGHNLLVWDGIDEVDPEVSSGFPLLRSFNIGINVAF